jgi:cbb3-type cytochrome oxidase subunit 1
MGLPITIDEQPDSQEQSAAKAFALTSGIWFAFATSFGMIAAGYLIAPDFMANIEYIQFGRVRPIHVNLVLFGFVTPGLLAVAFYYTPRLLRTHLFSQKLGVITAVLWNIMLVIAVVSLAMGYSQGREYAELPWAVDIMIAGLFALVIYNLFMTVSQRQEPILYVSIWYSCAAVVMTAVG